MSKKNKQATQLNTQADKSFREDLYGIILLVAIVLFILFIGYSSLGKHAVNVVDTADSANQQTSQDFAGKAFAFSKILPQSKGSCTESDIVTPVPTGFNPFERGQIIFSYYGGNGKQQLVTKTDHCKDSTILIEYNCDNYATTNHAEFPLLWTEVHCDYGCDQEFGRCSNGK